MCTENTAHNRWELKKKLQEAIQLAMGLAGNTCVSDGNRLLYQHQATKLSQIQSALELAE